MNSNRFCDIIMWRETYLMKLVFSHQSMVVLYPTANSINPRLAELWEDMEKSRSAQPPAYKMHHPNGLSATAPSCLNLYELIITLPLGTAPIVAATWLETGRHAGKYPLPSLSLIVCERLRILEAHALSFLLLVAWEGQESDAGSQNPQALSEHLRGPKWRQADEGG